MTIKMTIKMAQDWDIQDDRMILIYHIKIIYNHKTHFPENSHFVATCGNS